VSTDSEEKVIFIFGKPLNAGDVVTEDILRALLGVFREVEEYRELQSRPDFVRHELGLCGRKL
jgi:hypothetical protein